MTGPASPQGRTGAPVERRFLMLQGPHGPFFADLAAMLEQAGCSVWRVAFNAGDVAFWRKRARLIRFDRALADWPDTCAHLLTQHRITDLVLYGDTRAVHAQAVEIAREKGLQVHVFEEGYLRPYWVTYERGGSNGHSRLMSMSVDDMRAALEGADTDNPEVPTSWGDMRHHIYYGALYHFNVMVLNQRFPRFRPHRAIPVQREFLLYLKRLVLMPLLALDRMLAQARVTRGGFPYHLVLLQLEHDSAFQHHSPFSTLTEFLDVTLRGFAEGAPRHHHLVFKAHPLEDGRSPVRRTIRQLARSLGIADRVHFVPGGKLARLLDQARSAVTVNSTAAQQVLHRGLPLKAFGNAVFAKPEFVSAQPLPDFFAQPTRPESAAYRVFRSYLLDTSQVAGGFYSARGRRHVLRQAVDMMLAPQDPYEALASGQAPLRQQPLRLVR